MIRRLPGDRGSFALELAILAPFVIALFMVVYGMGSLVSAQSRVQNAARDAARAATASGDEASFGQVARSAAAASLPGNWNCTPTPKVPPAPPAGQLDRRLIYVEVTCHVPTVLGVSKTIDADASSPVDPYRSELG